MTLPKKVAMKFRKREIQDWVYSAIPSGRSLWGLAIQSGGCGFFGDVFMTLEGLRYCQRMGIVGRPRWGRKSLYLDRERGGNAWDYFFLQSDETSHEQTILQLPYWPSAGDFAPSNGQTAREIAAASLEKFVRVRPEILAKVDEFTQTNFGGPEIIGVHVRGTDARAGVEGRLNLSVDDFVKAVEKEFNQRPSAKVYLATDEEPVVERFRERFGRLLVVRDCLRSTSGESIHGHYDKGLMGSPYQKGMDVLLDALILARCDHLIRGHSRVTCYSLCVNPKLRFTDLELLAHGVMRTPWLHY